MKHMIPVIVLLLVAFLFATFAFQARAEISEAEARDYLKQGAKVVDVRTVEEFSARHLTNVINIPLSDLGEKLPSLVTNKSQVLLLHCRTGRRSGIAEKQLHGLGYTNAFNIGSFQKAERIVNRAEQ
jgi:phage shock protein E